MNNINCNVSNCSHNKDNNCYANRINIGGKNASKNTGTCCGSFLNRLLYSDLTNNTDSPSGKNSCLICYTQSCKHNHNCSCELSNITISGENPAIYTETSCESFEPK